VCLRSKYLAQLLSCYLYFPVLELFTSYVYTRFPYLNSLVLNCDRNEHRHCDKDKHTGLVINKGIKIGKFIDFFLVFPLSLYTQHVRLFLRLFLSVFR
jgi:hypothetical protein